MKTPAILFLLVASAFALACNKGGLPCDQGNCHYPSYIEGCLTYSADDSCLACEYNYRLVSGACFYAPNVQGSDCCSKFDNASICIACNRGLFLNPATNLCEDRKIQGCLVKNGGACSICASDYDLVGGLCAKSIVGCSAYDQYLNCISCNTSFQFSQGNCVPMMPVTIIANCQLINQYGCAQCNQGLRANKDGSCTLPAILGCLVYGGDGNCLQCENPFFQLQNGKCSIVGCLQYNGSACSQCNSALGFVLNNQICAIPNCTYFDSQGCSTCQNGLVAGSWGCRNPSVKVCLICKNDEFLGSDGVCRKKDIHCVKYQNGVCTSCCDSFFLDANNKCQQKVFGCAYSNGVCSSCVSPFTFSNGNCIINGCLQYSAQGCVSCDSRLQLSNFICGLPNCNQLSGFTCVSCVSGYQLVQNQGCVPVDPNCKARNSMNVCLSCKEGFMFDSNNFCISMKVGCNYVDGICTSCRAPFTYVPNSKSCVIDGCLSYFIGGCSHCNTSYTLLYNSCKLPNCLISSNGKCLQCDPDYVFTSLGVCVSKDEFCEKMDAYGTCIKCTSSYYYSKKANRCVKRTSGCVYDDNDNCCSCQPPFSFSNGQCSIYGCSSYNDDGCYECKYPFELTSNHNHTCQIRNCNAYKNGVCVSCKQGFALNSKNLCVSEDPNCLNYNIEQTKCLSCVKGYKFDESNRCEYADQHCWDFDPSGICMNCDRIYFLNPYGKCQLRDPQCKIYTNGFCSQCSPYYFVNKGVCFPNLKGCKTQQCYNKCLACDNGYNLNDGVCKVQITQLSWNDVVMDFNDDSNAEAASLSKSTFTTQFTSTTNLVQALATNSAKVFFSSSALNNAQFQVDSQGNNGWSPVGACEGAYVGIQTTVLQTFYALDVKTLTGSSLSDFSLEYSLDGSQFIQMGSFSLSGVIIGSVKTFYFTPVYAKYIRIVVKKGTPNIKFEFYFSSNIPSSVGSDSNSTFIGKTVSESIEGANGGVSICGDNGGLCWAGVQACEPKYLSGFSLFYTNCTASDVVDAVSIDYSMDGVSFTCWNNCTEVALSNSAFTFPSPLLAQKVHIHFGKYRGNPRFGIKFTWAQA